MTMARRLRTHAGRNIRSIVFAGLVLALIPLMFAVPEAAASGTLVLPIAALAAQAVALLWSQTVPGVVLLVSVMLDAALLVAAPGDSTGSLGVALAAYSLHRDQHRRRALAWMLPLALVSTIVSAATGTGVGLDPVWNLPLALVRSVLLFALPAFIAELVVGRRRLIDALRERAELAEREQASVARQAMQQQRTQMARELHDIAAHHLTGIIVSAQAANALAETDRATQRRYLDALQGDARAALDNLRLTVGLLRSDEAAETHPAPTLADLPRVISEAEGRGMRVHLVERGVPGPVGPVTGTVVIRGVQEALANALKHAPGSAVTVTATWLERVLSIEVENAAAAFAPVFVPSSGYGLIGLRERLALIDGTLEAGPSPRGWRTAFSVPLDAVPSDAAPADRAPSEGEPS
jgi:signal transduction histidine kinase